MIERLKRWLLTSGNSVEVTHKSAVAWFHWKCSACLRLFLSQTSNTQVKERWVSWLLLQNKPCQHHQDLVSSSLGLFFSDDKNVLYIAYHMPKQTNMKYWFYIYEKKTVEHHHKIYLTSQWCICPIRFKYFCNNSAVTKQAKNKTKNTKSKSK